MKSSMFRFISVSLFSVVFLAGCASKGSEFLGTWINAQNPIDSFQIVRNGNQYLIVSKDSKVGATYEKGMLEVKGILGAADLTYDKKTDTILTPGFFGQVEYRRKK
jgi:hypothetical protein